MRPYFCKKRFFIIFIKMCQLIFNCHCYARERMLTDQIALASQWQNLTAVPPLAWSESLYDAVHDHNLANVGP